MREVVGIEPEDEMKEAGTKFKIGDIVTVKENKYEDDRYYDPERLYVVRYLPRREEGQLYFRNTYALISNYHEGLFTFEWHEKEIEKYEGTVDNNSAIGILQKIVKGELKVSQELWDDLKIGKILLDDRLTYKEIEELVENE